MRHVELGTPRSCDVYFVWTGNPPVITRPTYDVNNAASLAKGLAARGVGSN